MITRSFVASSVACGRTVRLSQNRPSLRHRKLSFVGWLKDVSHTGKFLPSNPIQESFALIQTDDHPSNNNTKRVPDFTQFQPHHLRPAFVKASRLTQTRLNLFQQKLANFLKYYPEQTLPMEEIVGERHQLPALIVYLVSLQNLYFSLVGSDEWKRACSQIPLEANWESDNLRMVLEHLYQSMAPSGDDDKDDNDDLEERRYIVYKMMLLYRLHTITALDSVDLVKLRYRISEVERIFRDPSRRSGSTNATTTITNNSNANNQTLLLQDMVEYFVLKQDLARSRGMDTFADWILKDRMLDRFRLLSLLKKVLQQADKTVEKIILAKESINDSHTDVTRNKKDPESRVDIPTQTLNDGGMDGTVNQDQPPTESPPPIAPVLMSFELESVLETMFRLVESLFGVVIDEEENVAAWHPDVRLFHVYEESEGELPMSNTRKDNTHEDETASVTNDEDTKGKYLGSFYIDPLARPGKEMTVTNLGLFMGTRTVPILATHATLLEKEGVITLNLPFVLSLFKSMGGAIQSILAGPILVGFNNRHVHLQDIEPLWRNFMEHWLTDDRVLYSLSQNMFVSGERVDLDDASGNASQKLRAQSKVIRDVVRYSKALALSEFARVGAVEVELFSTVPNEISPRQQLQLVDEGTSAVVSAERLQAFLDKRKVSTDEVVFLLQQNSEGYPMSYYRHVLSDILAARLFLTFQSLLHGKDEQGHRDEGDPMDQLAECHALGHDFRRRFAQPRPPWRVHKDLEQFCGDKDVFSPAPLDQIYKWDG